MTTMMTVPQMTLMFLGTVVGLGRGIGLDVLGIAEAGATSAQARSLRAKLTNVCGKLRTRLNAACVQVPSDSLASTWPANLS